MRGIGVNLLVGLGVLGFLSGLAKAQSVSGTVDVRVVKYKELGETIRQFKGRIVVVDFWADT